MAVRWLVLLVVLCGACSMPSDIVRRRVEACLPDRMAEPHPDWVVCERRDGTRYIAEVPWRDDR